MQMFLNQIMYSGPCVRIYNSQQGYYSAVRTLILRTLRPAVAPQGHIHILRVLISNIHLQLDTSLSGSVCVCVCVWPGLSSNQRDVFVNEKRRSRQTTQLNITIRGPCMQILQLFSIDNRTGTVHIIGRPAHSGPRPN